MESRNRISADKPGQGSSRFREFVRGLPDEMARQAERGQPVTFPLDALRYREAGERASLEAMLQALGVTLT